MAHGTPERPEDLEAFYTRIRRGRPPSAEQLAELAARYEAIGGTSPLARRTRAQVEGLAADLEAAEPRRYDVAFGAKHTHPSIEDAATALAAGQPDRVVGLVLTPHHSTMGSGEYLERAGAALGAVPFVAVEQWYDAPGFAALVGERVTAALARVGGRDDGDTVVLFTAHSLPQRIVAQGDPYPGQVEASAALVAAAAGVERWQVAWQSAGATPEPWLGPDLVEVIRGLPTAGARGVVVCPIGFVADHLEVLYDVDYVAREAAEVMGLRFARTSSLNDDRRFIAVLASVVQEAAGPSTPPGMAHTPPVDAGH